MSTLANNAERVARILKLMKQGDDAFNARDYAGMKAVHHPDMVAHVAGAPEPIRGQVAHAAAMEEMFRIFPDVHVYNDPYRVQFAAGDWSTVICRTTGTFKGEMVLPNGRKIAPTGKAFDLDFATVARWDGDLLIEEYAVWDSALQAKQIGIA